MANKRTQKLLEISKTKSEKIVEWFVNEAHWKVLSENMELGKTAIFKYKKILKNNNNNVSKFELLAENFTLKQINIIITVFNDYIENPEKYEKPRKKSEVDLKDQEGKIRKHMKDMHMKYPTNVSSTKIESTHEDEEDVNETNEEKIPKIETPKQLLERHAIEVKKEQEELNNLKEGSTEKAEKEREFKRNAKIREAEFRDVQKKNNNSDD